MKIFAPHLLLILGLFMMGCASAPTPDQLAQANYGTPPTDYEDQIKSWWQDKLIDPTVPLYTFHPPSQGWMKSENGFLYGYWVDFTLNSKNRFGGYVGSKRYSAFFYRGHLNQMAGIIGDTRVPGYFD